MSTQGQRDRLLERAKYGEISGEDADKEAIAAGLEPFSKLPDPEAFDPDKETYWTLPMAVAWIAFRSKDMVRKAWGKYCAECWHWIWQRWRCGPDGQIHEGWVLEQWLRPTLARLSLREALRDACDEGDALVMTVKASEEALWVALREGLFEATGIDTDSDRRVQIPALDWHQLVPVEGRREVDEVRYGLLGTGFREVLVPGRAIRGLWKVSTTEVLNLPALTAPDGDGYMPLFCAAQWIATSGGSATFDPTKEANWRPAFAALLDAIASDRVRVVGTKNGAREQVPGYHFAGCEVDYPFSSAPIEMIMGEHAYLQSHPYLDDAHWRGGFDDSLVKRREVLWSRLMVAKTDVRQGWQLGEPLPTSTGVPGRPTSMHHVEVEFERRGAAGELAASLDLEARALAIWLSITHSGAPPATPKTIKNRIRSRFRDFKAQK